MRLRIVCIAIAALLLLPLLAPAASAVTREELDRPEVFLKQSSSNGTCVLVSAANMLRRAYLLQGDEAWGAVTLDAVREQMGWMPYKASYNDLTILHDWLPGGSANVDYLKNVLSRHPEGVVLHARCVPHGVLLTDFTDGVFYCCDPAVNKPKGRIPISQAQGVRIENSSAIWYVASPLKPLDAIPEITAETAVSRLVEGLGNDGGEASPLFGQALACHC